MRTKQKTLIATLFFTILVMGLMGSVLAKENDNMRKKIDYLEYILRECAEK